MKMLKLLETKQKSLLDTEFAKYANEHYEGDFTCHDNQLTSLEGAPTSVSGNFWCDNNQLTSLKRAPTSVGGHFICDGNKLTSLEGAPTSVGGNFWCDNNRLTSLEGAPTSVGGLFWCANNMLTSLEGAPTKVGNSFSCNTNQLTSLEGIHKQIKQVDGEFIATNNPIKSHVLGLLLISGLKGVKMDNKAVADILVKHLGRGMDGVLAAQEELIDAGFEDFAQL